jgi:hypothetical protein
LYFDRSSGCIHVGSGDASLSVLNIPGIPVQLDDEDDDSWEDEEEEGQRGSERS